MRSIKAWLDLQENCTLKQKELCVNSCLLLQEAQVAATEYACINEYDNVCQQLDDARLALRDLQEINLLYKNTIETESSVLKVLSQRLEQKQEELDDLKKSVVAEIRNFSKDLDYLKNKHSENQR